MSRVILTDEKDNRMRNLKSISESPLKVYFEMIFGTVNIIFSILMIFISLLMIYFRETIHSLIGDQFTMNFSSIIILMFPLFVLGILLHAYSLEKLSHRYYKMMGFFIFILSFIMIGIIMYFIFRYSLNWLGTSLFGNTSLGNNKIFYVPVLGYLFYGIFLIYYSLVLMRK
jgi:hypothetical protein